MSYLTWDKRTKCIVAIEPTHSVRDLRQMVSGLWHGMNAMDAKKREYKPPTLVVHGFNGDRRQLWEIPRAVETIKRAHAAGFVAVLEPSTTTGERANGAAFGFGAFEVWLIATGQFQTRGKNLEVDRMALLDFVAEVMPAEELRVERMIAKMREGGEV